MASSTPGNVTYGVRFVNNTGLDITGFTITYAGEQWRVADKTGASNANEQLVPGYAIFDAGTGSVGATGTYTAATGASVFNTPIQTATPATMLDGNAAANRVAGLTWTVTNIAVANGRELWIRFYDADSAGTDHGIAVDDFTFSAVLAPEPATLAALAAAALLGTRRRRRASR